MSEDGGGEPMRDGGINEESSPTDPQTRSTANANIHVNIHTNIHADTHTQTHPRNSDAATEQRPRNLLESSSLWTRLTFSWVMPLLNKGLQNQDLKEIDLPHLAEKETSEFNLRMMNDLWAQEQRLAAAAGRSPNLKMAILKLALAKMWFVQPMMLTLSVARIGQSLALGQLVEYFEGNLSRAEGYLYASIVAITALITLFANHNAFFHTWKTGMQLRIAAIACIYDKTLRLKSVYSSNETNSGQVMNLASNDVERFILSTVFLLHIFWGPMEAVAVLIIGILSVGPAFAAGYVLLFCFIIVQFYLGIRFVHFRSKIAQITDSRVTMVSQVIAGIRVVKMMGWELAFLNKIKDLRQKETSAIQDATKLKAWNEAIFFAANTTVSAVIFLVHVYSGNELTARHVFTTFTLLNVVQLTMTKFFAFGIMANSEVKVSIERIQKFLETEEIDQNKASSTLDTNDYFLQLLDVTCHWNSSGETSKSTLPELERPMDGDKGGASTKAGVAQDAGDTTDKTAAAVANIDMNCKPGAMYCIIGPVGSGKSALIQVICGELLPTHGIVARGTQTLAYAPQDPFIMDGTVRENILFGLRFNSSWYNEVVKACGLDVDFRQFQDGDSTIVGDRGVQCSGGQRARIGLARALYKDADILVVDDPLSAVDARVGNLIFHEALERLGVDKGKCVILATHQHQYLTEHVCLVMEGGRIAFRGTYQECAEHMDLDAFDLHQDNNTAVDAQKQSGNPSTQGADSSSSSSSRTQTDDDAGVGVDAKPKPAKDEQPRSGADDGNGNQQKEAKQAGKVGWGTWTYYAKAMGGLHVSSFLLFLYCSSQAAMLVCIAEIGKWGERSEDKQTDSDVIGIVTGLTVIVLLLSITRALAVFHFAVKASQRLHDSMTQVVLRSKIEFFDTNPIGRILNRFSADVGSNDDALPHTLYDFVACVFMVVGAVITAASVLPFTLIAIPFLTWSFIKIRHVFITSSRELKRLEAVARSPIFAMLSESLSGISTIRSNAAVEFYKEKFRRIHDSHSRAFFIFIASSRWLGFRMDGLVVILLIVSSFLAVVFHDFGWFEIDPALVGLALSLLIMLAGLFQWTVRQSAEIVNQMISVERVAGYTQLPSEAPVETEADKLHPDWPSSGGLKCQNLKVRYRDDLPPALQNISFDISGGERIGCVGRTGSGKSSLIQTLVRILEPDEGQMLIDGVDIATLGLNKLRHNISVIPQSPVLFSGSTVRENIDPFNQFDDDAIKSALTDAQMWDAVANLPGGLQATVAENGSNFSVGQRQLLCLARAILRKTKILVLDEPSANVDNETDLLLQEAISANFKDSTIIAVAHRLDTVIEYDKIIVLNSGHIVEFDTPINLIEKGGDFSQMVKDTGHRSSETLTKRASMQSADFKTKEE